MHDKRLLIVEDDEVTAGMLEQMVSVAGYEALIAHDGVAAVQLYQQALPAVVLLDINLPDLDGYSFATLVRNYSPHQPKIIVVTASPEAYEEHLREITDGCLAKPIVRQQLLALLNGYAA